MCPARQHCWCARRHNLDPGLRRDDQRERITMELQTIKDRIPDYAKDLRLNLDAVINRSSLTPAQAAGAAVAAAFAAKSPALVVALQDDSALEPTHRAAALTAAALMGMNNVWYPFVEMAADPELKTMRPELRMNAYASHGGIVFSSGSAALPKIGRAHV